MIRELCIKAIRFYQRWISPLLGPRCRFYPTCSEYALICLKKQSFLKAIFRILKRIICCNPLHPGGVDLPWNLKRTLLPQYFSVWSFSSDTNSIWTRSIPIASRGRQPRKAQRPYQPEGALWEVISQNQVTKACQRHLQKRAWIAPKKK